MGRGGRSKKKKRRSGPKVCAKGSNQLFPPSSLFLPFFLFSSHLFNINRYWRQGRGGRGGTLFLVGGGWGQENHSSSFRYSPLYTTTTVLFPRGKEVSMGQQVRFLSLLLFFRYMWVVVYQFGVPLFPPPPLPHCWLSTPAVIAPQEGAIVTSEEGLSAQTDLLPTFTHAQLIPRPYFFILRPAGGMQ